MVSTGDAALSFFGGFAEGLLPSLNARNNALIREEAAIQQRENLNTSIIKQLAKNSPTLSDAPEDVQKEIMDQMKTALSTNTLYSLAAISASTGKDPFTSGPNQLFKVGGSDTGYGIASLKTTSNLTQADRENRAFIKLSLGLNKGTTDEEKLRIYKGWNAEEKMMAIKNQAPGGKDISGRIAIAKRMGILLEKASPGVKPDRLIGYQISQKWLARDEAKILLGDRRSEDHPTLIREILYSDMITKERAIMYAEVLKGNKEAMKVAQDAGKINNNLNAGLRKLAEEAQRPEGGTGGDITSIAQVLTSRAQTNLKMYDVDYFKSMLKGRGRDNKKLRKADIMIMTRAFTERFKNDIQVDLNLANDFIYNYLLEQFDIAVDAGSQ